MNAYKFYVRDIIGESGRIRTALENLGFHCKVQTDPEIIETHITSQFALPDEAPEEIAKRIVALGDYRISWVTFVHDGGGEYEDPDARHIICNICERRLGDDIHYDATNNTYCEECFNTWCEECTECNSVYHQAEVYVSEHDGLFRCADCLD